LHSLLHSYIKLLRIIIIIKIKSLQITNLLVFINLNTNYDVTNTNYSNVYFVGIKQCTIIRPVQHFSKYQL